MPGKLGYVWDYQENDILIIPGNLGDLYSQDHEAKRLSPCATHSNQVKRVILKVP